MSISIRDIQEKEFAIQAKDGYNVAEVDDFLDEIVEQLEALYRENAALTQRMAGLQADVDAARKAAADAESKIPDYNEKSYFDNLQKSLREAMIGAQRIADDTVADAKAEAEQLRNDAIAEADATLTKAKEDAAKATAEAQAKCDALKAQYDDMKAAAASFKAEFGSLLEQQTAALRSKSHLF